MICVEGATFESELIELINRYHIMNESDTPDFILADYLLCCLNVFNAAVRDRDGWYQREVNNVRCNKRGL